MKKILTLVFFFSSCALPGVTFGQGAGIVKGPSTGDSGQVNKVVDTVKSAAVELKNGAGKITAGKMPANPKSAANHGNYCGAGWSNGEWNVDSTKKDICKAGAAMAAPIDETDALCMAHDKAYCSSDPAQKDLADRQLIDALKTLQPALIIKWKVEGCENEKITKDSVKNYALTVMDRNPKEPMTEKQKTCAALKSQMAYGDSAIAAFTAKRNLYQKNITADSAKSKLDQAKEKGGAKFNSLKSSVKSSGTGSGGAGTVSPFRW